jgi:hypothetical protein
MSTITKQYTHEEVRAAFNAAQTRLKPAVLKNTSEDRAFIERLITQHMLANQLEPTAENFYAAFKALFAVLPWQVKPAKLQAQEQNERPIKITAKADADEFNARKKAAEVADEKTKAEEKVISNAYFAISAFTPVDSRTQRVAYGKQAEVQKLLRDYVAKEVARKADATSIRDRVLIYIRDAYDAAEKVAERV